MKKSERKQSNILCLTFGLFFLVIGIYNVFTYSHCTIYCTKKTTAVVTNVKDYKSVDLTRTRSTSHNYVTTIKYLDQEGTIYEKNSVGTTFKIRYNPNNTNEYMYDALRSVIVSYVSLIFCFGLSLLFLRWFYLGIKKKKTI